MLLKDARRVLRQLAQEEPSTRIDLDDDDAVVVKVALAQDTENEVVLSYIARRGKGNSSVYVWAYISIWSKVPFEEPDLKFEQDLLDQLSEKDVQSLRRLRISRVHEYAYLSPSGSFLTELVVFRPEEQGIGWTLEHLRSDFATTLAHARTLVPGMPSTQRMASLLSQRRDASFRRHSEA